MCARILDALRTAGINPDKLQRQQLSAFDEFHGGGIASTRDLARYAGITEGMRIADIGCGIGGPARTLADEFGCHVTGVDLTPEFVRAATMLTGRVGMDAVCDFKLGSATAIPLPDASFDAVWSQNMMMNVADKATFFSEVVRILKPGGVFAFEAVLSGNGAAIHLPAFWASHAAINHLVSRSQLEQLLTASGLQQCACENTTAQVIAAARKRSAVFASADPGLLTVHVIVPHDVTTKMANALRNNEQGRTVTVKALYLKAV
jgi:SAM-dependent methyltransferase